MHFMKIRKNEPLKNWNGWKVGGLADYFCQPETPDQLKEALQWSEKNNQAFTVLGGGTNVLISDQGVEGLLISTAKLNHCSFQKTQNSLLVECLAGTLKSQLMKVFKIHKLAPALFLSGLPGDIGGGIVMNAGVSRPFKPSEFSEIVKSFEIMTAKGSKRYEKEDVKWSYRKSSGWEKGVIYRAQFEWPLKEMENLNNQIKAELKKRRSTQPLEYASCGSVFKNPYPQFAGELIEKSGLKNLKIGAAQVSQKHGNFIVNLGGAKAQDIDNLIQKIRGAVYNKFAVSLEPEIHYVGRWNKTA